MPKRADVLLVDLGLAQSRERAKALIMEGVVYFGAVKVAKASDSFPDGAVLTVREDPVPFVSRGGLKLNKAIRKYVIDLSGLVCLDVGASTGGFTDCMLQNGAAHVYAVDVGYGQLDWKLRNDPRVTCMEKTNARYLTPGDIAETPSFASVDVSFISLTKLLGVIFELLDDNGICCCLIKPQFEAGREKVGKHGVVRDPAVHEEVIEKILSFASEQGFFVRGLDHSPVKGPEGNIEYLCFLSKKEEGEPFIPDIEDTVKKAHVELSGD